MNEDKLGREKDKQFELGHISQLNALAKELRNEAGEIFAYSDRSTEIVKARKLKSLAQKYEERANKRRKEWEEEYQ